jgi:hypothetical protein
MGTGGYFLRCTARPGRDADNSPHLVPRSRMSRSYTFSPPIATVACSGTVLIFFGCCITSERDASPCVIDLLRTQTHGRGVHVSYSHSIPLVSNDAEHRFNWGQPRHCARGTASRCGVWRCRKQYIVVGLHHLAPRQFLHDIFMAISTPVPCPLARLSALAVHPHTSGRLLRRGMSYPIFQ